MELNKQNKKIKNATTTSVDGVSFKSKSESSIFKLFLDNGIKLEYEPEKITLIPKFKVAIDYFDRKGKKGNIMENRKGKTILPITYTPDFMYEGKKRTYVIEVKGFANDTFPLKKKLFLSLLSSDDEESNITFAVLYNKKMAEELIKIIKQEENGNEQLPQPPRDSRKLG